MEPNAVKFASDSEVDIEGLLAPYGGPFNGKDITAEFFSAKTDFALGFFAADARPLLFHHGLDPKTGIVVVGRMKSLSQDEMGLWMRAQLDAHNEYYGAIKELIKQGKLGLSSGSMRHLVEVNPKSGEILRWPLIEGSLTPTPANPMAEVDFATAKSHFKAIGVDIPDEDDLKAKLTAAQEKNLSDADFAYIDSQGGRHLPIHDEAHVRNALARFNQTQFESEMAKEHAKKKLMAAAHSMGIDVAQGKSGVPMMQMMDMMKKMVADMGMEMPDAEMQAMMGQMGDMTGMPEEEVKKKMQTMLAKHKTGELFIMLLDEDSDLMARLTAEPLASHAEAVKILATCLLERTKDLKERRVKEGRMISAANRKRLMQCIGDMRLACDEMQGLIDSAEPQPAKAASARLQIELLKLYAATIN